MKRILGICIATAAVFASGYWLGNEQAVEAASARVFELRTYTAAPGKLEDLKARFRDHTVRLFEKHGMTNIGYWVPMDGETAGNTVIYLLAYPSREARQTAWAAFGADPDWRKARAASEANGRVTTKVESVFLAPTDFSPLQ